MDLRGRQGEAPMTEAASSSVVVPTTGRGKPRLSRSLSQLILQAFEGSSSRKVLSLLCVKESLAGAGYPVNKNSQRLKKELCSLVSHGLLSRVSGSGASASFKLGSSQVRGAPAARSDPGKKKKAVTPKKAPVEKKKASKKQPAAGQSKGPRKKLSVKKQLSKHPARGAAAKKAARKRN